MIARCERCGKPAFPRPLLCRACGSDRFTDEPAAGVVEETTLLRRAPGRSFEPPVPLASVRTDAGPVVIARLASPDIGAGARVRLELEDGAPAAHLAD